MLRHCCSSGFACFLRQPLLLQRWNRGHIVSCLQVNQVAVHIILSSSKIARRTCSSRKDIFSHAYVSFPPSSSASLGALLALFGETWLAHQRLSKAGMSYIIRGWRSCAVIHGQRWFAVHGGEASFSKLHKTHHDNKSETTFWWSPWPNLHPLKTWLRNKDKISV